MYEAYYFITLNSYKKENINSYYIKYPNNAYGDQ